MNALIKNILWFTVFVTLASCSSMQPSQPIQPSPFVNDQADLLTPQQLKEISVVLDNHNKVGPGRIFLRTIKTLPPNTAIEKYAFSLALEKLQKPYEIRDDVFVVVALEDRKMRIEVSPTVQSLLPDAFCQHVVDDIMIPSFRRSEYYAGIHSGVVSLIDRLESPLAQQGAPADSAVSASLRQAGG